MKPKEVDCLSPRKKMGESLSRGSFRGSFPDVESQRNARGDPWLTLGPKNNSAAQGLAVPCLAGRHSSGLRTRRWSLCQPLVHVQKPSQLQLMQVREQGNPSVCAVVVWLSTVDIDQGKQSKPTGPASRAPGQRFCHTSRSF